MLRFKIGYLYSNVITQITLMFIHFLFQFPSISHSNLMLDSTKFTCIFNPNSNMILNPDSTIQFLYNSFSAIGFRICNWISNLQFFNFTPNFRIEKPPDHVLFISFCNSSYKFIQIWVNRSSILIQMFFHKVSIDMFSCKIMVNYWTILTMALFFVLTIIDFFFEGVCFYLCSILVDECCLFFG